MFHTVAGLEHGTITVWQAELLAWSFRKAGETGPLTLIEAGGRGEFPGADVFETPNYRFAGHDDYPRAVPEDEYAMFNRLYGLRDWLRDAGPECDTVLIVDADVAWFEPFDCPEAPRGAPVCQQWVSNDYMRVFCKDNKGCQTIGVPLVMHKDDLTRMLPRWIERTHAVRDARSIGNRWMAEMGGMTLAAKMEGLVFDLRELDNGAFLHYFPHRPALGPGGFHKFLYQPWNEVPVEGSPANQRLAALVNEYVSCRSTLSSA